MHRAGSLRLAKRRLAVVVACALWACGGSPAPREGVRASEDVQRGPTPVDKPPQRGPTPADRPPPPVGPTLPAVRLPDVPPPIAPPSATGDCVPAADVDAYAKALEAHTLATLTKLAAAEKATLVKRATYYLENHKSLRPSPAPTVVTVEPGSPYDDQGRITVARKPDGVVRLFEENPRHHVVEILVCGTTCNIRGGAMVRPLTLVFNLAPGETLGPPLATNVDAWSVYRAELDVQTCYGNSPPP